MTSTFRPRTLVLFLGDVFFFTFSLWATLYLRSFTVPTEEQFFLHLIPFSLLFFVWVGVFFIAGLYESRSLILARRALSETLLTAQIINVCLAALFFFFAPLFLIAPKTILFIYLAVSFLMVLFWRGWMFPALRPERERAIMVGEGGEINELSDALRHAHRAPVAVMEHINPSVSDLSGAIKDAISKHDAYFVIADFDHPQVSSASPELYNLVVKGVRFMDLGAVYEEVFGRVPLSRVDSRWVARNVSGYAHVLYDTLKRLIDIVAALVLGLVSLFLYPFIVLAIKLDDGGPAIISMPRVGEAGLPFNFYKFRSMSGNDKGEYGANGATKLRVTRVGRFLRAGRLDELPQLWNVFRGDLSLIGPRPEVPSLVAVYEKEIPYYALRHLIKPGLSGSAQLYHHGDPHHMADVEATRMKFAYDLFYLKHRSLTLDLSIMLKTIRRLLVKSNA